MIAPTAAVPPRWSDGVITASRERLGFFFPLLLVWICFDFGRPSNPLHIPLVISFASLAGWFVRGNKQWTTQSWCLVALLAAMAIGIPLATNTRSAFNAAWDMAILFLCIVLPLQSLLTSVQRLRLWIYTFIGVSVYVGAWAMMHQGYGPSGGGGAQDENYVAALLGMAAPFSYFSLFAEKRRPYRVLLVVSLLVFCAALVAEENPSRGGFLGLCAVMLYCLLRSPRRMLGLGLVSVVGIAMFAIAGPAYWAEIATSTDTTSGTADLRLELWKIGVRMWRANPVFGVGGNNYSWRLGDYQSAEQMVKFGHNLTGSKVVHSLPVQLLSENGAVGVVAVTVLLWVTWVGLGRVVKAIEGPTGLQHKSEDLVALRCYADAVRAGMVAILVNGVFLSLLPFSHLWLLVALGCAIPHIHRSLMRDGESLGAWATPMAPPGTGMRGGLR
jgi:O-antigen ligase